MRRALLLLVLIVTGTAHAAMLCARPRSDGTFSTTVKLREACRGNEVELGIVTLQPLRLFGPTTTSSSTTTSTLPSCGPTGRPVGGFCWYAAGDEADNCNQICAGVGRTYDEATRTFAGSAGTLANCVAVAAAFGIGNPPQDLSGCTTARGCSAFLPDPDANFIPTRCVTPATTAEAVGDVGFRFCACS